MLWRPFGRDGHAKARMLDGMTGRERKPNDLDRKDPDLAKPTAELPVDVTPANQFRWMNHIPSPGFKSRLWRCEESR